MLMKDALTTKVKKILKTKVCECGFTLDDCIRSGKENEDGSVGVYAGCANCYTTFSTLFDPIIKKYHKFTTSHSKDFDVSKLDDLELIKDFIVSTRIRVGRNLKNYPFGASISKEKRIEVEKIVVQQLKTFNGDLSGEYFSLNGMDEADRLRLVEDHFLFKSGDRFQESAGLNRDWPFGRGIFHSKDKNFLVWLNEEDQLRIISMQMGGDIFAVFKRLARALEIIEQKIDFEYSKEYGYLTSCPTNLGTAMRASVHIKLPKLSAKKEFKTICSDMQLSVRGIHGEFSESADSVYDISNKQRLGLSEVEIIKLFYSGVKRLVEIEKSL